jgi:hypothetical protein
VRSFQDGEAGVDQPANHEVPQNRLVLQQQYQRRLDRHVAISSREAPPRAL